MENQRRRSDRRLGIGRRDADVTPRALSWQAQRAQYLTRYFFLALGFAYFNLGGVPYPTPWADMTFVNGVLVFYAVVVTVFLWRAYRWPDAAQRVRATMWVDLLAISFAVMADPFVVSPGYLVYLTVIFGNGMRYGLRFFAEAAIGTFLLGTITVAWRFVVYPETHTLSTYFFMLFGGVLVLYAYVLTMGFDRARKQLEIERSVDVLTGLLNRRAFYEQAEDLFRRVERDAAHSLAVLFADLDHFKRVNDTHGHQTGDQVLAEVARVIADCVRRSDVVARFGGDEFILILPDTDLERADLVAQRLQEGVAGWSRGCGIDLGLTIGLAQAPRHGTDLKTVLERVDRAMYQGKLARGRGGILRVEQVQPA